MIYLSKCNYQLLNGTNGSVNFAQVTIRETYKFYMTHPTNGEVELFPINKKIEFKWTKDSKYGFFRKDLVTELIFKDDEFKLFYDFDRSNRRCEKIEFTVIRKKQDDYLNFYYGYFALIDGDFDVDRCILKIKPRIKDKYTSLLENWDKEQDFIGGEGAPSPVFVSGTKSKIEETSCYGQIQFTSPVHPKVPNTDCLEFVDTWTFVGFTNEIIIVPSNLLHGTSNFAREYIVLPDGQLPAGSLWTQVEIIGSQIKWARPLQLSLEDYKENEFTNGRRLNDVLTYLLNYCNLKYKSGFFNGIQEVNNTPYNYAIENYKDLIIFKKSDVRREKYYDKEEKELPHVPATKAVVKLKELIDWLSTIFNFQVDIEVNEDDGTSTFVLEHMSYFSSKSHMIDLTTESNQFKLRGKHGYKYLKEEFIRSEKWNWMEQSNQIDFDAPSIIYKNTCVTDSDAKDQEYTCGKITTNVGFIVRNKSSISNDGFVIMATDKFTFDEFVIRSGLGRISNVSLLNNPLTLSSILYNLHRHGRYHKYGDLNNIYSQFYDVKKKREGREITTGINEDDVFEFDPKNHRVKTQLNWGDVSTARLVEPESLLSFTLHHD